MFLVQNYPTVIIAINGHQNAEMQDGANLNDRIYLHYKQDTNEIALPIPLI